MEIRAVSIKDTPNLKDVREKWMKIGHIKIHVEMIVFLNPLGLHKIYIMKVSLVFVGGFFFLREAWELWNFLHITLLYFIVFLLDSGPWIVHLAEFRWGGNGQAEGGLNLLTIHGSHQHTLGASAQMHLSSQGMERKAMRREIICCSFLAPGSASSNLPISASIPADGASLRNGSYAGASCALLPLASSCTWLWHQEGVKGEEPKNSCVPTEETIRERSAVFLFQSWTHCSISYWSRVILEQFSCLGPRATEVKIQSFFNNSNRDGAHL